MRGIVRAKTYRCLVMKRKLWCTNKLRLYLEGTGDSLECFEKRSSVVRFVKKV